MAEDIPEKEKQVIKSLIRDIAHELTKEYLDCGIILAKPHIEEMLKRLDKITDTLDKLVSLLGEQKEELDKLIKKENPFIT